MDKLNIIRGQRIETAKLARSKELRREMTPAERVLWHHLRRNALDGHHFRRQQIVDGFIVDFYCHEAGLVVEVDGPIHEVQREADAEREQVFAERALPVLRFKNEEVLTDLPGVLGRIREACRQRPNPPTPFPAREGGGSNVE